MTPGRWLLIEVKRLLEIAGLWDRESIGRGPVLVRADLERRSRRRRCVDGLGVRVSTASTRAARMLFLRPDPAVPIDRPPTAEAVLEELATAGPALLPGERARASVVD